MNLDHAKEHLKRIIRAEFDERDTDLVMEITTVKQEMNRRGLLYSSITMQNLSKLFAIEFRERCIFVRDLILSSSEKVDFHGIADPVTEILIFFQEIIFFQRNNLMEIYNSSIKSIKDSLLSSSLCDEINSLLYDSFERLINKNNSIITYEYTAILTKAEKKEVIFIKPNFYGIQIDIKELIHRIFRI